MSPEQLRRLLKEFPPEERIALLLDSFIEIDDTTFSPFTGMVAAIMTLAKRMPAHQQQVIGELLYRAADRCAIASLAKDFAQEVSTESKHVRRGV